MKGHGREMIQLGVPVTDAPGNEAAAGISKGMTMIMEGTCICPNTNSCPLQ